MYACPVNLNKNEENEDIEPFPILEESLNLSGHNHIELIFTEDFAIITGCKEGFAVAYKIEFNAGIEYAYLTRQT